MMLAKEYILTHKKKLYKVLITLVGLSILTYLGTWQLERAAQKKYFLQQLQDKSKAPPTTLANVADLDLQNARFTPVQLKGSYVNEYTFLLDNQVLNKKVGYRVISAFAPEVGNKWLLVDRGYITRDTYAKMPNLHVIPEPQHIQGIINTISTGLLLRDDVFDANTTWPIVLQSIDYKLIAEYLQRPVYNFLLQVSQGSVGTYIVPEHKFSMTPAKHMAYAFQWFAFALILLIYSVITSLKRD